MKVKVILITLIAYFSYIVSDESENLQNMVPILKIDNILETIIKNDGKDWIISTYAPWDALGMNDIQEIMEFLYNALEFYDFTINLGLYNVIPDGLNVPNYEMMQKLRAQVIPSIIYIPCRNKTTENIINFDLFYPQRVKIY